MDKCQPDLREVVVDEINEDAEPGNGIRGGWVLWLD